jgi:hypothetical protein
MASTSTAGAGPSSGAAPSGQNPHPLLENNEEKNRFVASFAYTRNLTNLDSMIQRGDQSRHGGRFADWQDKLDGQVRRGQL